MSMLGELSQLKGGEHTVQIGLRLVQHANTIHLDLLNVSFPFDKVV